MQAIILQVNGQEHSIFAPPTKILLQVLRQELALTGTKCGCDSASCGACKVLIDGQAVNACTVPIGKAQGKSIVTIEGVAAPDGGLHPLQKAFIACGAVQCGFCTPGMVISALAFLQTNPNPTRQQATQAIDKNLCRCTGYVKIVDAIMSAAKEGAF